MPLEEVYFICIYLAIGLNLSQTTFTNEIFLIHCTIYQKIKYTFENVSSPLTELLQHVMRALNFSHCSARNGTSVA